MIHEMKPYPEYKDSGLPWVGKVPQHWDLAPNKSLLRIRKEIVGAESSNFTLLSLTKRGIIKRDLENPEGKFPASFDTYQRVRPGDLIYCLFDIDETPRTVGLSNLDGMITGAYTCFETIKPEFSEFIYFYYLSMDMHKSLKPLYSGLRKVITKNTFLSTKTPLPPAEEHDAILRFIKAKTFQISQFIRNKRRLIELLKEQKQAIINQAVTRGIEPNVRLKPSGVDWLGDIPEHWEVMPIKRALSTMDYGTSESATDSGSFRVLTMGHVKDGVVKVENCGRIEAVPYTLILDHNDLLFNRTNSLDLVAKVGLFTGTREENVTFASYLVRMKTNEKVLPQYLNFILNSPNFLSFARRHAIPSLHQANLNATRYGRLQICLPPENEQKANLDYIENRTSLLNSTLGKALLEIDLMREYRTRLISDVVTGKVDVRDVPVEDIEDFEEPDDQEFVEELDEMLEEDDAAGEADYG